MEKKVRITLEMDAEFVKMLQATYSLRGLGNHRGDEGMEGYKRHTAADALAVVALMEARGATPEQVHVDTPIEWRPHIQAIHEERRVFDFEKEKTE